MDTDTYLYENQCRLGESATRPSGQRYGTLTAFLLVAGISRSHLCALGTHPRRALSTYRIAAHSGASNHRF
jgi:hypothetical protein